MSGPKRNPDALNTIGVVVVGICGAVLVYVSIVALQAFYMNDTSEVQTMADYGGQDTAHQSLRATQTNVIEDCGPNSKPEAGKPQTYRIPIKYAIKLVADGAKVDPSNLVPTQGRSDKPTILPIFGRPKLAPKTETKTDVPPGGAVTPAPAGAGSAEPTPPAAGSAAPTPTESKDAAAPKAGAGSAAAPKAGAADTAAPKAGAGSAAAPKAAGSATEPKAAGSAAAPKAAGSAAAPKAAGSAAPKAAGSAAPKAGSNK